MILGYLHIHTHTEIHIHILLGKVCHDFYRFFLHHILHLQEEIQGIH